MVLLSKPSALGLALACLAACAPEARDGPTNLLLVTLDTTRADVLAALGGEPGTAPELDALAEEGALFTRAWSETNVTNPSHLTILSGLRALDHGVISNDVDPSPELEVLPELLREAGYRTAGFTAVEHLARVAGRGFEVFPGVVGELDAEEVTERALAWLRDQARPPFFLWVHYFDPHVLYEPPAELAERFYEGDRAAGEGPPLASLAHFDLQSTPGELREWLGDTRDPDWAPSMYAAEVHHADRQLGRLLEELERLGLRSETAVIVAGDHGESLGEHGIHYDHKGLYEPQLRIPLVIDVPDRSARRIDVPVTTLDLAPTIAELLGVRLSRSTPGTSLVPLLSSATAADFPAERGTFVHQHMRNQAVAVRHEGWKLVWSINREHPLFPWQSRLFDLRADPEERVDLSGSEPRRVAQLRALAEPWIRLGPVRPGERADLDPAALERLRALGY